MELNNEEIKIRKHLIEKAKSGDTVSYSILCSELDLPYSGKDQASMTPLYKSLDKIAVADYDESSSLLTAVVVSDNTGYPGKGFFTLAVEKGKFNMIGNKTEQILFFAYHLEAVFKYWQIRD